jgi:hypothetical protein
MRHAVLSPTYTDALRLTFAVQQEGWYARIVGARGGHVGVIIHAPLAVLNQACHRVGFEPGRTLGA